MFAIPKESILQIWKELLYAVQKQDYMPQNLLQNKQVITAEGREEFKENKIAEKII